jgi:hypothetical protein
MTAPDSSGTQKNPPPAPAPAAEDYPLVSVEPDRWISEPVERGEPSNPTE